MPSPVEDIKSRLSVVEVVGSYIRLQKAGTNFKAPCPFHHEKTPSFFVSPARELWHCFGCNAGGDIFAFVSEIEGVEFPEALEILASRAGVQLKKEDPRLLSERKRLLNLLEDATKFFISELKSKNEALLYLKERGLRAETASSFRVGYAPADWRSLTSFLSAKGYERREMERAGLSIRKENGEEYYDRFRGRIMFPVWDSASRIVGFSGRIFDPSADESGGKYINTPQTMLYDKSRILYLWDRAKNAIRKEDACILVEGQMDALMSHQAGFFNTVAVSGTALGNAHLSAIKRLTSRLLFAFDADGAGEMATRRGVDMALGQGFDVHIIEVPSGKDPAETVKENPELWREAVGKAKPVIAFFLDNLRKKFGNDFRAIRSGASALVLPYVASIENAIEKAHWVQEVSKTLALQEAPIWEELKKISLNKKNAAPEETSDIALKNVEPKTRRDLLEERILGMVTWKKEEFSERLDPESREYFSLQRRPPKEKLEKLALEAELRYGETGGKVHEEFDNLITELARERTKGQLEALASEIRKCEASGDEAGLRQHLEEFKTVSKKLSR